MSRSLDIMLEALHRLAMTAVSVISKHRRPGGMPLSFIWLTRKSVKRSSDNDWPDRLIQQVLTFACRSSLSRVSILKVFSMTQRSMAGMSE